MSLSKGNEKFARLLTKHLLRQATDLTVQAQEVERGGAVFVVLMASATTLNYAVRALNDTLEGKDVDLGALMDTVRREFPDAEG